MAINILDDRREGITCNVGIPDKKPTESRRVDCPRFGVFDGTQYWEGYNLIPGEIDDEETGRMFQLNN